MGNLHVPDEVVTRYVVDQGSMDQAREEMRRVLKENQPDVDINGE